jgi:hypothetical protein
MGTPTRTLFTALVLASIVASVTGCWAEGGGDPNGYSSFPAGDPALAAGAAGSGETESLVWHGSPVDSSALQTGAAGSGADMGAGVISADTEQDGSDSGDGADDGDPVDPDSSAPTGSTPTTTTTSTAPTRGDASTDTAADPFTALFPPATTTTPDRTPSPDNPAECPDVAPDNPFGDCLGLPVYVVCTYGTYTCICDWYHWMCAG